MAMLNEKLTIYLTNKNSESVILSFDEIQTITGMNLTSKALCESTYWGNGSSLSKYWKNAGFVTKNMTKEIAQGRVAFYKMQDGIVSEVKKTVKKHSIRKRDFVIPNDLMFNNESTYNPPAPQTSNKKKKPINKEKLILSDEMLLKYKDLVKEDTAYGPESDLICNILKRFPENTDSEIVALKVSLIDLTNTTQLSRARNKLSLNDLVEMIIKTKDFDERIKKGDRTLVSEIAGKCKKNNGYNPFSFISKYCTYHNVNVYEKDDFSIFDNVLKNNLPKYIENIEAKDIDNWRENCDYESYWQCIDGLLKYLNISIENKRRAFDYCIWYYYRPEYEDE